MQACRHEGVLPAAAGLCSGAGGCSCGTAGTAAARRCRDCGKQVDARSPPAAAQTWGLGPPKSALRLSLIRVVTSTERVGEPGRGTPRAGWWRRICNVTKRCSKSAQYCLTPHVCLGLHKAVGCPKRGRTPHGPRLAARMAPGWGSLFWPKINPLVLGHPIHSTPSLVRDNKPSASS